MTTPENDRTFARTMELSAPMGSVFEALTDPAQLGIWFAEYVDVQRQVGGSYRFWGRHTIWGVQASDATQQITRYEPPRALGYRWTWDGHASEVLIELSSTRADTELVLTHTFPGSANFPGRCSPGDFWTTSLGNLHHFLRTGKAALLPDVTCQPEEGDLQLSIDIDASAET